MSKLYVYFFCSRNKDNKEVFGFKKRSKTILAYEEDEDKIIKDFKKFVAEGVPGESSRMYRSVNSRNEEKIREEVIIRLLRDKLSMTQVERIVTSAAQKTENREESKWLFDFDVDDKEKAYSFIHDVFTYFSLADRDKIETYRTPHGYAVIVPHGFDTRELMEKWKDYDITLKRDELLFKHLERKEEAAVCATQREA